MSEDQRHHPEAQVHSITDADEAASIEARKRFHAYAFKMALRVVLMIAGAIVSQWNLWIALVLLGCAVVIPWFAVVDANVEKVDKKHPRPASYVDGAPLASLETSSSSKTDDTEPGSAGSAEPEGATSDDDAPTTIQGEWAEDQDEDKP